MLVIWQLLRWLGRRLKTEGKCIYFQPIVTRFHSIAPAIEYPNAIILRTWQRDLRPAKAGIEGKHWMPDQVRHDVFCLLSYQVNNRDANGYVAVFCLQPSAFSLFT